MAALHALYLANTSAALKRVYTYGQPRTGNAAFASAFDARLRARNIVHYRVTTYRDPVPHLPMHDMFFEGWVHSGHEVYYNATRRGAFRTCDTPNTDKCADQWNWVQTLTHSCDHCSYLGMNPCTCGDTKPECEEPRSKGDETSVTTHR